MSIEGGAVAGVGHRLEALVGHACASDVHAIPWYQFAIRRQINRRHCISSSEATASGWSADDREGPVKQMSSASDVTLSEQLPYATAGDRLLTPVHFGIDSHGKAKFPPEFFQYLAVSFSPMAKMETCAFVHFLCAKAFDHNLLHEFPWRDRRQLLRER